MISRAFANGRVAHAYLLHGPDGAGKEALALAIASTLLCENRDSSRTANLFSQESTSLPWACDACSNCKRVTEMSHPDVHVVFPRPTSASEKERTEVLRSLATQPFHRSRPWENPGILIDDIRALKRTLSTSSYEGTGSVVLLLEANRMRAESANALLKILEEPPPATYFVLTATSLQSLLPTIVSRCQPIAVSPAAEESICDFLQTQYHLEAGRAAFIAKIVDGNLRNALELLDEDIEARRQLAVDFLRMAFKFNKPVEQMVFLKQLANENDRRELQQLLRFCRLWIRDAYVLRRCGSDEQTARYIVNTDFHEALQDLNKNLPQFDFEGVLNEIEVAIECIERYVQPWLVLIVLLHRIRQLARPRR